MQPQMCAHKSQRITREWDKRVKAVNSLSRPRLSPQVADHAKSQLHLILLSLRPTLQLSLTQQTYRPNGGGGENQVLRFEDN